MSEPPSIRVDQNPPPAPPDVAPITVAIPRSSLTREGAGLVERVTLQTVDHQPNVVGVFVAPVVSLGIRFANNYLTTLGGLLAAAMTTNIIPAKDFEHLLFKCLGLSLAGPGVSLVKDLVTVFGDLEKKYPLLTGKV